MPDVPLPHLENAVADFLERKFPGGGKTILDGPYLDIKRPNLHDLKSEFRAEKKFVDRTYRDLFALFRGMVNQREISLETARDIPMDFNLRATARNRKDERPKTAVELTIFNAREVDYWTFSKLFVSDLLLSFSIRKKELEEQERLYWSSRGRPPDHYARAMALRLALLFAKHRGTKPTIGTASEGDHPSTEYGRALQELFEILEIETGFRLPGEWAISHVTDEDLPRKYPNLLQSGLMPNLLAWNVKKNTGD